MTKPPTFTELADRVERSEARRWRTERDSDVGRVTLRFRRLRSRYQWLDHSLVAGGRYARWHGDMYAMGMTAYSFLAVFPLLLVAVAIGGFLLRGRDHVAEQLAELIASAFPGDAGELLGNAVQAAQDQAGAIGTVSLLVFLLLGTNWVGNLRLAIQRMWGTNTSDDNFFREKAIDLVALLGLGVAAAVSLGLTVVAGDVTESLVSAVGLGHVPGAGVGIKVSAVAAALAANSFLLYYLMVVLPRHRVPRRSVLRGVLLGAAGLEILKVSGTLLVGRILAASPAVGFFGAVLVLIIWMSLLLRWLMLVVCWTATSRAVLETQLAQLSAVPPPADRSRDPDGPDGDREQQRDEGPQPTGGDDARAGDAR